MQSWFRIQHKTQIQLTNPEALTQKYIAKVLSLLTGSWCFEMKTNKKTHLSFN